MEPMDLDHWESPHRRNGEERVDSPHDFSDMEVDNSPLYLFSNSQQNSQRLETPRSVSNGDIGLKMTQLGISKKPPKTFKTGYGIPDDDMTFSHFPEKGNTVAASSGSQLSKRKHRDKSDGIQTTASEEEDLKFEKNKKGCFRNCCGILFKLILLSVFICVCLQVGGYVLQLQKEKCLAVRQFSTDALITDLESFVFGQSLASKIIPAELDAYFTKLNVKSQDEDVKGGKLCKPLVLSFHGWTGVGKNFVSKIMLSVFANNNAVMQHLIIPLHFPHQGLDKTHKDKIHNWIVANNTDCSVNVMVIDEMDKASLALSEGIKDAIEDLTQPCQSAQPTIVLLLSNSYATDINKLFFKWMGENPSLKREVIPVSTFDSLFSSSEDHWSFMLVKNQLVDAFIPFLPLEKVHVEQCVKRELVSRRLSTDAQSVSKILDELTFVNHAGLEVSTTGCKRVEDKIDFVMYGK